MEAEKPPEKPFNIFGLSLAQAGFILALIIYFFLLHGWTRPVPNFDTESEAYHYASLDGEIPPTYVTSNHLAILIGLTAAVVVSFITKEVKSSSIDIEEARRIVDRYLVNRKTMFTSSGDEVKIKSYYISSKFIVKSNIIKDEEKPLRYVLQVNITDEDGYERNFKTYVHPFERKIYGFVEIEGDLKAEDTCPACGKEADKVNLTDELKKFTEFKKILTGERHV